MATIVTRAGKGSPLTNQELDSNFSNLNTDKAELSGANFTGSIDVTGSVTADGLTVDGGSSSPTHLFTGARAGTLVSIDNESTSTSYGLLTNTASVSANSYPLWVTSNDVNRLTVGGNGDISFYDGSGNQGLFWDSSTSRLGLGTTAPSVLLDLGSSAGQKVLMWSSGNIKYGMAVETSEYQIFAEDQAVLNLGHMARSNGSTFTPRLTINADGSSVFSGAVTSTGLTVNATGSAIELSQSATGSATYYTMDNTVETGGKRWRFGYSGGSSDKGSFSFYNQTDNNLALLLASSGATFSGDVVASRLKTEGTEPTLFFNDTTTGHDDWKMYADWDQFQIQQYVNDTTWTSRLHFAANGNATFSGRTTSANSTVGSGTASTYVDLTVNGASTSNYGPMIELQSAGTAFGKISNVGRIQGGTSTDMFVTSASTNSLVLGTNNTPRVTIDSAGRLLVGISGASGFATLESNDLSITGQTILARHSGSVLVGTTSQIDAGKVCIDAGATGNGIVVDVDSTGGYTNLLLDRTASDGTFIACNRGSGSVGSIGTRDGDLVIGTDDAGLRFYNGINAITPFNVTTNADLDAATDLGTHTIRFEDLWLSGGVYLGGTGAANKLDDYEEGTWTPTGVGLTLGSPAGTYTKVGRLVTVNWLFVYPTTSSGSQTSIAGLPFTVGTGYTNGGNQGYVNGSAAVSIAHITAVTTSLLYRTANGGVALTHADLSGATIRGSMTYMTA